MASRWYAIHTYTGKENEVKDSIENLMKKEEFKNKIFEVIVPTEEVIEIRESSKAIVTRKIFPGYMIVNLDMDYNIWRKIKNIPGVTSFVGAGRRPVALEQSEVDKIKKHIVDTKEKPKPRVTYVSGDQVKVVSGPFETFTGSIDEVYEDKGKLKVMITIFGRETPVELDYTQVEKI